jgi:hypothetical protein
MPANDDMITRTRPVSFDLGGEAPFSTAPIVGTFWSELITK